MSREFREELVVDDTKILDIPLENLYRDKQTPLRVSGWTARDQPAPAARLGAVLEREGLRKDAIVFRPGDSAPPPPAPPPASRFGEEWERAFRPVPLDSLTRGLTADELEYFLRLHRLDELNARCRRGEAGPPEDEPRSPSPEPVYDAAGKRVNTREQRARDAMRIERANLIEQCQRLSPSFLTPRDWRPLRRSRKIYLPAWEGAELSYGALVLGARGRTQQQLEELSGCRVSVRRAGGEPAHVLLAADDDRELERGVEIVLRLLGGQTLEQLTNGQMRTGRVGYDTLALETVLRDRCTTCREEGHKAWNCPYARGPEDDAAPAAANPFSLSMLLRCAKCGRKNHLTRDCRAALSQQAQADSARDEEYAAFLRSVGVEKGTGQASLTAPKP